MVNLAFPPAPGPATFESGFDTLVAEMEADPAQARLLADGRRWVGQQFYGLTLAGLRLAAGLSQRQLAEACGAGIEQPHISRYESGRVEPGLNVAARLASAMGVGLDVLHAAWTNTLQQPPVNAHGR